MKKALLIVFILSIVVVSAFAVDVKHSFSASLGFTPSVGYELDVDRFNFGAEFLTLGGRLSAAYDVIPSDKHDLDLGVSASYVKNPLLSLLLILFTAGQYDGALIDFDINVCYRLNFNEQNGIFLKAGMPVVSIMCGKGFEKSVDTVFGGFESVKSLAGLGALTDVSIGYRYTF